MLKTRKKRILDLYGLVHFSFRLDISLKPGKDVREGGNNLLHKEMSGGISLCRWRRLTKRNRDEPDLTKYFYVFFYLPVAHINIY